MKLSNPYATTDNSTLKRVEFFASKEHIHELQSRLPRHGSKDAILSCLFHRFITELKPLVPVALSVQDIEENEQRLYDILHTFKLHV